MTDALENLEVDLEEVPEDDFADLIPVEGIVRVRIDFGYDGTDFAGWAKQPGLRTVEDTLEQAFAQVLRMEVSPRIVVAGRTDAGVHAAAQVAHVDIALNTNDHFLHLASALVLLGVGIAADKNVSPREAV